jgi:hypothetical protein
MRRERPRPFVTSRLATLCLTVILGPGCAALNQTVLHEVTWQPPVFLEVSRQSTGLSLRVEDADPEGVRWVVATERFECIEEATQLGLEVEERKPRDWVLGAGAVLGGGASAAAIGLLGGVLTSSATSQTRTGQQSGGGQIVGVAIGVAGAFGQLLAYQKIIEGLNSIRFQRQRPLRQELGRKLPCAEQVLWRARLAEP